MIEEPTVFILGAGASKPYGYPTGDDLRKFLCESYMNEIFAPYIASHHHPEEYREALVRETNIFIDNFFHALISIDQFVSINRSNQDYHDFGKLAIASSILYHETKSLLPPQVEDGDWFSYLFTHLMQGRTEESDYQISENRISFITFNYDRSLESFFYYALCNTFTTVNEATIVDEINMIPILHINGQVARLPWSREDETLHYRSRFREIPSLTSYAGNIKIIYDDHDGGVILNARDMIQKAKRIFILGFGFAVENLKALSIPSALSQEQTIIGTALGLTVREIAEIRKSFLLPPKGQPMRYLDLENCDALQLLRDYL